jgi:hypothetical protein
MFVKRAEVARIAERHLEITGIRNTDYEIDGNRECVLLLTCDQEKLTKGRRQYLTTVSTVVPSKRLVLIKPHPFLVANTTLTGTTWIDPEDDGVITFNVIPRDDIDVTQLPYIAKVYMESLVR